MDSAKDAGMNLAALGDVDGAGDWLCWRSADLKSLPVSFGSGCDFGQTAPDKEIAAQAVAFVVNSSRKGIVSLCADVASLMRAHRSLEERLMTREGSTLSRLSGDAAACSGWTTRSNSSASSAAVAAAHTDCCSVRSGSSSGSDVGSPPVSKDIERNTLSAQAGHPGRPCSGWLGRCSSDRPPLRRQSSGDSTNGQQWSCDALASGSIGNSANVCCTARAAAAPAVGDCADRRLATDGSPRPQRQEDSAGNGVACDGERHNGCLLPLTAPPGTVTLTAADRCEGDGQPAAPTCCTADRCCAYECHVVGPAEPCRGSYRSCYASDDEVPALSNSQRSRGVQVCLQAPTAEGSATRCSSCRSCEERLNEAAKINRKLRQQLSAAHRELNSLREKVDRSSVVAPDEGPSSPASRHLSPVGVTNSTDLSTAVTERCDAGSRRKSCDDSGTRAAAATTRTNIVSSNGEAASVKQSSPGESTDMHSAETAKGRSASISKANQREVPCSVSESGGSGGSSTIASPTLSTWGALGKLRRLIKRANVDGGALATSESRSSRSTRKSNVRLNDEVLTTCNQRGVVRYVGPLDNHGGGQQHETSVHVGLQLYEPGGTHDGTYNGKRYFSCEQNHGLFVALQDIKTVTSRKRILRLKLSGSSSSDGSRSWRSEECAHPLARSIVGPLSDDSIPVSHSSRAGAALATVTVRSRVPAHVTGHSGERRSTLPTLHNWTVSLDKHRRSSTDHMSSA